MFKSLDSIAWGDGIFMYLTISKFKQVLRSWKGLGKGLDYNTDPNSCLPTTKVLAWFAGDLLE